MEDSPLQRHGGDHKMPMRKLHLKTMHKIQHGFQNKKVQNTCFRYNHAHAHENTCVPSEANVLEKCSLFNMKNYEQPNITSGAQECTSNHLAKEAELAPELQGSAQATALILPMRLSLMFVWIASGQRHARGVHQIGPTHGRLRALPALQHCPRCQMPVALYTRS